MEVHLVECSEMMKALLWVLQMVGSAADRLEALSGYETVAQRAVG